MKERKNLFSKALDEIFTELETNIEKAAAEYKQDVSRTLKGLKAELSGETFH